MMNTLIRFAHRKNPDRSIDSICTTCFQTIASEDSAGKLISHEERHSCDPYWHFSQARLDSRESTSASSEASALVKVKSSKFGELTN